MMSVSDTRNPSGQRTMFRTLTAVLIAAAAAAASACGDDSPTAATPRAEYAVTDVRVGTGAEATTGRLLTVHYVLWSYDPAGTSGKGTQLQSSAAIGPPFQFTLGAGNVISGWDRGVPGMRVGGLRRLVLPPEFAYGAAGNGPTIPPNATLVFEIELLNVQ